MKHGQLRPWKNPRCSCARACTHIRQMRRIISTKQRRDDCQRSLGPAGAGPWIWILLQLGPQTCPRRSFGWGRSSPASRSGILPNQTVAKRNWWLKHANRDLESGPDSRPAHHWLVPKAHPDLQLKRDLLFSLCQQQSKSNGFCLSVGPLCHWVSVSVSASNHVCMGALWEYSQGCWTAGSKSVKTKKNRRGDRRSGGAEQEFRG